MGDDILSRANRGSRPEPNVEGDFQCQTCRVYTSEAHYDGSTQILRWWCKDDHESKIEEFSL